MNEIIFTKAGLIRFTLILLMIIVAIVEVLAEVAYSRYDEYVRGDKYADA